MLIFFREASDKCPFPNTVIEYHYKNMLIFFREASDKCSFPNAVIEYHYKKIMEA